MQFQHHSGNGEAKRSADGLADRHALRATRRPLSVHMFSSTTEYALRAAVFLAAQGGASASSERIAEVTHVPSGYISKVMRDLVVAGLVESQRGPNGGFTLALSPTEITVLDVVNAVAPIQRIEHCPLGNPMHTNLCPLHRRLDDAIASLQAAFRSTTLAELCAPVGSGGGAKPSGPQCGALTISAKSAPRTEPAPKPAKRGGQGGRGGRRSRA